MYKEMINLFFSELEGSLDLEFFDLSLFLIDCQRAVNFCSEAKKCRLNGEMEKAFKLEKCLDEIYENWNEYGGM